MSRWFRTVLASLAVASSISCAPAAPGLDDRDVRAPDEFSVTLAWDAPATDATGDPLRDLAGYRLYWAEGTALDPDGGGVTQVDLGLVTTHTVGGLLAGRYVFAVTAVDEAGNESDRSGSVRATVGGS